MGTKSGDVAETGAERAQADHAVNLLQDYKQRWLPVQQQLASTIEQEGAKDSSARKLAAGKSSTDTAMQFDGAQTKLENGLSNSGAGPGSARANLAITGMGTDAAASTGIGHMMSDQSIDDAYTQGLGALTALGRGERAQVGQNMSQEAADSAASAKADASASLQQREGEYGLAGQIGGFGLQQGMKGGSGFGSTPPPAGGGGGPFGLSQSAGGMGASTVGMTP